MSWANDINVRNGDRVIGPGFNPASTLLKTAVTGLAVKQISNISKSNAAAGIGTDTGDNLGIAQSRLDQGTRLQLRADTATKMPVLYGQAVFSGNLIDAQMIDDNQVMWYAYALSETTGPLMSTGEDSVITFDQIFWDDNQIVFESDGQTIQKTIDRNGLEDNSLQGLVRIYCYRKGSLIGALPQGYTGTVPNAYDIMPGWTSNHVMSEMAFALIRVIYNKEKGVTGIGTISYKMTNSLTLPGDVLYDMMTNTRYGAGIAVEDIKVS